MRILVIFILFFFSLFVIGQVGQQEFANIGDFKLENGQIIPACKIGYRTFGQLNQDRTNAIVYPTWFGGTSEAVSRWIGTGPNKFVDSSKYFVIAIDALGDGVSSSPSLTNDPKNFPFFTLADMVRAEYIVITQHFGIKKLYGIIGGSMGGMQALEWLVRYPESVEKAIVYVSSPYLTSYDLLLMNTLLHNICLLQRCQAQESEILFMMRANMALCMDSAEHRIRQTSVKDFPKFFASLSISPNSMTSYDYASQLQAMTQYNICKYSNQELSEVAKKIQARLLLVISLQDRILNPQPALELSKLLQCPTLILNNPLGHLAVGNELPKVCPIFMKFWETGDIEK